MSQQVQELIDKIKSEGIHEAEKKSQDIHAQAQADAKKIIDDANSQAEQIVLQAKEEVKKLHESTEMSLKHASRDMTLSLRKEVETILQSIIETETKDALSSDNLAEIIGSLIKGSLSEQNADEGIEVFLNAKDLNKLKDGFVAKLQKQVKKPIKFHSAGDIDKGFMISFDSGKSSFDFTDESLANYLSKFLNTQVAALVQESIK